MKRCSKCLIDKCTSEFGKKQSNKDGLQGYCKQCVRLNSRIHYSNNKEAKAIQARKWAKANPDSRRSTRLKFNYGIDLDKYNQLFQNQKGRCKICERHRDILSSNLNVDHNHNTGKIRGLLCNQCNQAIGLLKEDVSIILKAAEYVKNS